MNAGGGEAADQLVKMMLSGGEVTIRLTGSTLKNVLALTMALMKNRRTLSGKVTMRKMLQETRDLRVITLSPEDYKKFEKLAKKQRILFSAIKNGDNTGQVIDVVLPAGELERANMVFQRIQNMSDRELPKNPLQRLLNLFQRREKTPEKPETERIIVPEQEHSQESEKQPEPQPEENIQKKDSQSRPGWQDIESKSNFQSRNRADSTMRMNERPSIEKRLQDYRAKAEKQHLHSRDKSKIRNRTKSKTR
jgi:hypothetical protein